MKDKLCFNIKLADIPIGIRCRYEENLRFFREYICEEEPVFTVDITEEELEGVRQRTVKQEILDGKEPAAHAEWLYENNAVHARIAEELVRYDVLLMHGSCICVDDKAYVFTAKSGTGKSTHTRLWMQLYADRACILNDDKPLLRVTEEGVKAYGSPWCGKHRLHRNTSAPLAGIASLYRDVYDHIERMNAEEAFPVLVRQAYVSKDTETMRKILAMEQKILHRVPFWHLGCTMQNSAAEIASAAMMRTQ